jgi:DNA-binding transcriptional ArsR family regulator
MLDTQLRLDVKAKLFRGLADRSRLAVLECLRDGPKCVSEITFATGLSQPNVSGHLACLRDCGLVERQQQGRFAYYRLAGPHVNRILAEAEALLAAVGSLVEECPRYEEGADRSDGEE